MTLPNREVAAWICLISYNCAINFGYISLPPYRRFIYDHFRRKCFTHYDTFSEAAKMPSGRSRGALRGLIIQMICFANPISAGALICALYMLRIKMHQHGANSVFVLLVSVPSWFISRLKTISALPEDRKCFQLYVNQRIYS